MGELSLKDMRELNARGRAAGLGLDLWPEADWVAFEVDKQRAEALAERLEQDAAAQAMRERWKRQWEGDLFGGQADEVLRRMSRHFSEGFERELLRPGKADWPLGSFYARSPYFVHVDPATGGDFTSTFPWPPGWMTETAAQAANRFRAEAGFPPSEPLLPRLKALFRRISPWGR